MTPRAYLVLALILVMVSLGVSTSIAVMTSTDEYDDWYNYIHIWITPTCTLVAAVILGFLSIRASVTVLNRETVGLHS